MADNKNVRHRFTVPVADTIVNEWVENQSNLGFSIRLLVKAFVRQYGNKDATCVELGMDSVPKRGRPSKQMMIRYGEMMNKRFEDDAEESIEMTESASVVKEPVPVQEVVQEPVHIQPHQGAIQVQKPVEKVETVSAPVVQNAADIAPRVEDKVDDETDNSTNNVLLDMLNSSGMMSMSQTSGSTQANEDGFINPDEL